MITADEVHACMKRVCAPRIAINDLAHYQTATTCHARRESVDEAMRSAVLGRALVQSAVVTYLHARPCAYTHTQLEQLCTHYTSNRHLHTVAARLQLDTLLEARNAKQRVDMAKVVQAFVGAIYLDNAGESYVHDAVQRFVEAAWRLSEATGEDAIDTNAKDRLMKHFERTYKVKPHFRVRERGGSAMAPGATRFDAEVLAVDMSTVLGKGSGRTKKEASLEAAASALAYLCHTDKSV